MIPMGGSADEGDSSYSQCTDSDTSSSRRHSLTKGSSFASLTCRASALACGACILVLCIVNFVHFRDVSDVTLGPDGGLAEVVPNDLHALHDMLLVGYSGVFMRKQTSRGAALVRDAAWRLGASLAELHPVSRCREQLAAVPDASGTEDAALDYVSRLASVAWACLPAAFSAGKFDSAFSRDAVRNTTLQKSARNPTVLSREPLGACRMSLWDRTCSYWTSLHLLAARAEMRGRGVDFLQQAITVLAGGATMCKGCQRHFHALHDPFLPTDVVRDALNDTELLSQL
eukprot:TRINITY_DN21631_c0_g1_i2.p2 TRINITY_DN21631_c0_g1~~TRINITY_DN21631_c0_g1_i2.p2  ORF type:complete len:316 (+),score=43.80 TRINITY_DN21631_c0_g1_i2:91-948(+)